MATVARQDLCARARRFSVRLLTFTRPLGDHGALPRRVLEQLTAAGTAIGADVCEAQSASSRRQMAHSYSIALREARESLYWLHLIHDLGLGPAPEAASLLTEAHEFVAMLTVSVRKLRVPEP